VPPADGADTRLDDELRSVVDAAAPAAVAVAVHAVSHAPPDAQTLDAIAAALSDRFPEAPGAILVADGRPADGPWPTPEAAEPAAPARIRLRPGRGRRALVDALAAAQRLEVRALAFVDAELAAAAPAFTSELLAPVLAGEADYAAPAYSRSPVEGTLTTNLLAPLTRALYGQRLQQVMGGCAALSARLVARCVDAAPGDAAWLHHGAEVWLTTEAVLSGLPLVEVHLGRKPAEAAGATPTDLATVLTRTVGPLFALMERHAPAWTEVRGSVPVPRRGEPQVLAAPRPPDLERLTRAFKLGLKDLLPVWEQVMAEATLGQLYPLGLAAPEEFRFPAPLWARVVSDFAIAYRERRLPRDHLLRSLTPLYLGRTAAFLRDARQGSPMAVTRELEHLGRAFEAEKESLVARWR
jgi:hypothetical protein